jgi:hypothetical protein
MASITFERLIQILTDYFGPPFLPLGHVKARLRDDNGTLVLCIGPRDVNIGLDGEVRGAGTLLCTTDAPQCTPATSDDSAKATCPPLSDDLAAAVRTCWRRRIDVMSLTVPRRLPDSDGAAADYLVAVDRLRGDGLLVEYREDYFVFTDAFVKNYMEPCTADHAYIHDQLFVLRPGKLRVSMEELQAILDAPDADEQADL